MEQERYETYMKRKMKEQDELEGINMPKQERMIWVTFKKEGIHKYPAALDDPKLATGGWDDVSFLGYQGVN